MIGQYNSDELAPPEPEFSKYIRSKDFLKHLALYTYVTNEKLGIQAKDNFTVNPGKMFILSPITFSKKHPHPITGSWINKYKVDLGNNVTKQYNIIFSATDGTKLKPTPLLIGESVTDNILAKDALQSAVLSIVAKGCTNNNKTERIGVIDTKILSGDVSKSWQEEWIIRYNDITASVPVQFTKTKTGTSYATSTEYTKCLNKT